MFKLACMLAPWIASCISCRNCARAAGATVSSAVTCERNLQVCFGVRVLFAAVQRLQGLGSGGPAGGPGPRGRAVGNFPKSPSLGSLFLRAKKGLRITRIQEAKQVTKSC